MTLDAANVEVPQQSFYFLSLLTAFIHSLTSLWMFHIFLINWIFKAQKLSRCMFMMLFVLTNCLLKEQKDKRKEHLAPTTMLTVIMSC